MCILIALLLPLGHGIKINTEIRWLVKGPTNCTKLKKKSVRVL